VAPLVIKAISAYRAPLFQHILPTSRPEGEGCEIDYGRSYAGVIQEEGFEVCAGQERCFRLVFQERGHVLGKLADVQ